MIVFKLNENVNLLNPLFVGFTKVLKNSAKEEWK